MAQNAQDKWRIWQIFSTKPFILNTHTRAHTHTQAHTPFQGSPLLPSSLPSSTSSPSSRVISCCLPRLFLFLLLLCFSDWWVLYLLLIGWWFLYHPLTEIPPPFLDTPSFVRTASSPWVSTSFMETLLLHVLTWRVLERLLVGLICHCSGGKDNCPENQQ